VFAAFSFRLYAFNLFQLFSHQIELYFWLYYDDKLLYFINYVITIIPDMFF